MKRFTHGTLYGYKRCRCRCSKCTAANTQHGRDWRAGNRWRTNFLARQHYHRHHPNATRYKPRFEASTRAEDKRKWRQENRAHVNKLRRKNYRRRRQAIALALVFAHNARLHDSAKRGQ
jgi:hypothetical protein